MIGPFEMVLGIVLIVSIAGVIRGKSGGAGHPGNPQAVIETRQLQEEVRAMKERIAVLERIATDRGNLLEREIEQLRDR